MPARRFDIAKSSLTAVLPIWWGATERRAVALLALLPVLAVSCFSPRTNPLDPKNPNAEDTFDVSLQWVPCTLSVGDTLQEFRFSVSSVERKDIILTIWSFDTNSDGRRDRVDTVFSPSLPYGVARGRSLEVVVAVEAVAGNGARGADTAQILPEWRVFSTATGLPSDAASAVAVDSLGNPWVGFEGGFLVQYDGEKWVRYKPRDLVVGEVSEILVDPANNKWVGTVPDDVAGQKVGGGLWLLDVNEAWWPYIGGLVPGGLLIRYITGLSVGADGVLWILTDTYGAFTYKADGTGGLPEAVLVDTLFFEETFLTTYGATTYRTVATDKFGTVWLGSLRRGLFWYDGKSLWRNYTSGVTDSSRHRYASGLPYDQVDALVCTPEGLVWVATPGGLARFDREAGLWTVIKPGEQFLGVQDRIRALAMDRTGALWIGMSTGVVRLASDGTARRFTTTTDSLPSNLVRDIAVDRSGSVWIATSGGVARYHSYKD